MSAPIGFTHDLGYPVRLRRTGALLGYLKQHVSDDRPWIEFYRLEPVPLRSPHPDEPYKPLPVHRLSYDPQHGCLWAEGSEFLRLEGATPA